MAAARRRRLSPFERRQLAEATQVLRYGRRADTNKPKRRRAPRRKKNPLELGYRSSKTGRGVSIAIGRTRRGAPKKNCRPNPRGAGAVRIGRVLEIRYHRDKGRHPGHYKHTFTSNASVWTMPDGSIVIR
jgi:hypothetical protein